MSYIGLPVKDGLEYYLCQKILGIKAAKEYCIAYLADPSKPEGYCTLLLCGCLHWFEEKVERHGLIRANRFWIVSKHNVKRLTKGNFIIQHIEICKSIKLSAKLRHAFKLKMELVLVSLFQLFDLFETTFAFVG